MTKEFIKREKDCFYYYKQDFKGREVLGQICIPFELENMPESFKKDISNLKIGESIKII